MLQLLPVMAIAVVITVVIGDEGGIVRSESLPFCDYSSDVFTCPGDDIEIMYPFWIENRKADETGRNCTSKYPENVVQHIPCLDKHYNISTHRSFAFLEEELSSHQFDWYPNCEEAVVVPVSEDYIKLQNTDYTKACRSGFHVYVKYPVNCVNCELSGGKCWSNETNLPPLTTTPFHCDCTNELYPPYTSKNGICDGTYSDAHYGRENQTFKNHNDNTSLSPRQNIVIGVSIGIGGLLLILLAFYWNKCCLLCTSIASTCKKKIIGPTKVEIFLDSNHEVISSHSYKYVDIKKMTNSFRDTLGQGGFGNVFKGKLRDGRLVAVKVLNESKGKGEDFINEVATIGRTNHVNVVSLLGFCAEGTKRALVYEFMPNGSLDKFIHNTKDSSKDFLLGKERLFQIALGIARGLEYLHRGCNTRILHFDIKPHNILLDKDFSPKISDFGLAKLCVTRESLVSMVGTRGTPGYIAPEVYCGNFGSVSHKSDIYSYGMMVLEMIGGRKNMDILVENTSQIYFPQWIYKRLKGNFKVAESQEIEATAAAGEVFKEGTEVFKEGTVRKMIIVALWCIQTHPGDRPSITKVVEMLEGNTECLPFPPNPFPDPSSTSLLS